MLLSRLRRLRQPKYFFFAIVGAAYFWFFFVRHVGKMPPLPFSRGAGQAFADAGGGSPVLMAVGSLALFALASLSWLLPTEKPGLGFTEAEAAFLFPAPLSRRTLIHFKLFGSQFRILFTALIFTFISNRWGSLGGSALSHTIGWWIILSVLSLNSAGAVLTLTRLIEGGVTATRRRFVIMGGLILIFAMTLVWVWRDLHAPTETDVGGVVPLQHYVLTILRGGALGWLLWPFRLVVAPFLASDAGAFFMAMGPALLILGVLYFWVMRMNVAFEEGSLASAEKRGAMLTAIREGKRITIRPQTKARRAPFRLAGIGRPELAFLWKNLISLPPWVGVRAFRLGAVVIVVAGLWAGKVPEWHSALQVA
ncbi:MAG: putative ABC exporter domain-containing protein, partial [Verrucomicrobiota bacterium]